MPPNSAYSNRYYGMILPNGSSNSFYAWNDSGTYKIRTSFYEEDSHKLVDVSTCALHDKVADEIILNVTNALSKAKISVYDERRNTGFLKHIIVRVAKNTGETMVILVASDNRFQGKNNFLKYLDKKNGKLHHYGH